MARLLTQALLHEDGVPALPLEAAFTWIWTAYIACVARAVQRGDPLHFVQLVLKAVDMAIPAGRHMVRALKPHCQQIRESFLALGADGRLTLIAAPLAGSMVPGTRSAVHRPNHPRHRAVLVSQRFAPARLVEAGTLALTLSGYDSDAAYSSPVARALAAAPLTLIWRRLG